MTHLPPGLPAKPIPREVQGQRRSKLPQARLLCCPQLSRRWRKRQVTITPVRPGSEPKHGGCGCRACRRPRHSPSRYHSARGCTRFRSGVTSSVHLRASVSPSLRKVTPNFSRNWTSKCMCGITEGRGTAQGRGRGHTAGRLGKAGPLPPPALASSRAALWPERLCPSRSQVKAPPPGVKILGVAFG